jgi:hypothetical protein
VQLLTGQVSVASVVVRLSSPSVQVRCADDPMRSARVRIDSAMVRVV